MNIEHGGISRLMALITAHSMNTMKDRRKHGYTANRAVPVGVIKHDNGELTLSLVSTWYVDKYGQASCLN